MITKVLFVALLAAPSARCAADRHHKIVVESVRVITKDELVSELPGGFLERERVDRTLLGVEFTVPGYALREFGYRGRNPVIRYLDCNSKKTIDYSFGPFINRRYVTEYVRDGIVEGDAKYVVVGTLTSPNLVSPRICALLESRSYAGVVVSSESISLAPQL